MGELSNRVCVAHSEVAADLKERCFGVEEIEPVTPVRKVSVQRSRVEALRVPQIAPIAGILWLENPLHQRDKKPELRRWPQRARVGQTLDLMRPNERTRKPISRTVPSENRTGNQPESMALQLGIGTLLQGDFNSDPA